MITLLPFYDFCPTNQYVLDNGNFKKDIITGQFNH